MSNERDLISRIMADQDLLAVTEAGIKPHFFQNADHREVFSFIVEHQRDYSQVPSLETFKRNYPTYRLSAAEDPLRYYVDTLRDNHRTVLLEDGLIKATDLFEAEDFEAAGRAFAETLTLLNQEITTVKAIDITENGKERIERYRQYAKTGGALKGISTGFHNIDLATGGMQGGQLFTFVGPPKAGKSTMLLLSAMFANMGFYRPLFIGFEMSNEEQEERHDAMRAHISHNALRNGTLRGDDIRALEKMARRMELMPPMIFTADPTSTSTLSAIGAQAEKYKPDVVYIDGTYMMDDENGETKGSPQALTNITRGLKRMAQNLDLPFAISTQVLHHKMDRKRGVTTASIGYASSFGQDSDVLIGVEPTDSETVNKVKILDGRNVKRMEFFVQWDWDKGKFIELEDYDGAEDEEEASKF